jgi:cytochrome c biogenesis protein CcmG/thiol:disulfide interchange protein DsbE
MNQPSSKIRLAAIAATAIALLAISVPFVFDSHLEAGSAEVEDVSAAAAVDPMLAPADAAGFEQQDGAACMANAPRANFDFKVKAIDGTTDIPLSTYRGKVVLLNFWATWCGPCKAEIPAFVELMNEYKDKGLVIVGYSVDDEPEKAAAFAKEYKINYPVLLGLGREDVQDAYGPVWAIPMSVIISKDGRVCKKRPGIAPKAVFEKEIKALL